VRHAYLYAAFAACAVVLVAPPGARGQPDAKAKCPGDPLAPAATPVVEIDNRPRADGTANRFGALQYPRTPLKAGDIALTIDDGPDPARHDEVLKILDQHCLKATFFFVGRYASARPDLVRETAARGHVIGSHSLSHPRNLRRLSQAGEAAQIRGGFSAVEAALAPGPADQRRRLAPFFRFPGLNDGRWMLSWLGARNIAVFSSDFGDDDWRGISSAEIKRRALLEANQSGGGVLIFHETRPNAVAELSDLIEEFERRGYHFVLIAPTPDARERAEAAPDPLIHPVR
jgi:peptidoglycan/xylan/chitin deacetylase (PgdA/CDA1 family)